MPFFIIEKSHPLFAETEHETLEIARAEAEENPPGLYIIAKTVGEIVVDEVTTRKTAYVAHDRRERLPRGAQPAKKTKEVKG